MADYIEFAMVGRLSLKPPVLPYSFFICASGICETLKVVGWKAASWPGRALSEYWLRPFPFIRGLHAGILLLADLTNQTSRSWVGTFSPNTRA